MTIKQRSWEEKASPALKPSGWDPDVGPWWLCKSPPLEGRPAESSWWLDTLKESNATFLSYPFEVCNTAKRTRKNSDTPLFCGDLTASSHLWTDFPCYYSFISPVQEDGWPVQVQHCWSLAVALSQTRAGCVFQPVLDLLGRWHDAEEH